jgi:hypothetical protein
LNFDPNENVSVPFYLPTWSGTNVTAINPVYGSAPGNASSTQSLIMYMNHNTSQLPTGWESGHCTTCHSGASTGSYYPGYFHSSLTAAGMAQPTSCGDCHNTSNQSLPMGFVGLAPSGSYLRSPNSPEMRHDAVVWSGNPASPTKKSLIVNDCTVCHATPTATAGTPGLWWGAKKGTATVLTSNPGNVLFHQSLASAGLSQPGSCLDCHGNTRPSTAVGAQNYLHSNSGMGDCVSCHTSGLAGAASNTLTWSRGIFHTQGSSNLTSCANCHESERPTTTVNPVSSWTGSYASTPFDYVAGGTNVASGNTHGSGQDCTVCHTASTTTSNYFLSWKGGNFNHSGSNLINATCIGCHSSQRPDLNGYSASQFPSSFSHATSGTGDCLGCHSSTVTAGSYSSYLPLPANKSLSLGSGTSNWVGGAQFPGVSPANSGINFVQVTEFTLLGSPVTGVSSISVKLPDDMIHTSSAIPAALQPGVTGNNTGTCYFCHGGNTPGSVSTYAGGVFHPGILRYNQLNPGAPVTGPVNNCNSCHAIASVPANIVQGVSGSIQPMNHAMTFTTAVPLTINGTTVNVSSVGSMDCSNCHSASNAGIFATTPPTPPSPIAAMGVSATSGSWLDGMFHKNIGTTTQPSNCLACHYQTMSASTATVTKNDPIGINCTASGTCTDTMNHNSAQMTYTQECTTCHAGALATARSIANTASLSSTNWSGGLFHASIPNASQPTTGCTDCHNGSVPTVLVTSASYPSYTTTNNNGGGALTLTNQIQHTAFGGSTGTAVQCSICHTATQTSNSWANLSLYHLSSTYTSLASPPACATCHAATMPGASYASFTHTSGAECNQCHTYPGTGTKGAGANWLGASGQPATVTITLPTGKTTSSSGWTGAASNLTFPHPTVSSGMACTTCHSSYNSTASIIGFDHNTATNPVNANGQSLANACVYCHYSAQQVVNSGGVSGFQTQSHNSASYSKECSSCHGTGPSWTGSKFSGGSSQFSGN